jgi:hypothetical protein
MKTWVVLLGFGAALVAACGSRPAPVPSPPPPPVAGSASRLSAGGGVTLEAAGILER